MKKVFPDTYDTKSFYEMFKVYKKAFEQTIEDAIGKNFDVAERYFYMEETAMIPNGRWMVESFEANQFQRKNLQINGLQTKIKEAEDMQVRE